MTTFRPPENVLRKPCAACGLPLEPGSFERSPEPGRLQHKNCPTPEELALGLIPPMEGKHG